MKKLLLFPIAVVLFFSVTTYSMASEDKNLTSIEQVLEDINLVTEELSSEVPEVGSLTKRVPVYVRNIRKALQKDSEACDNGVRTNLKKLDKTISLIKRRYCDTPAFSREISDISNDLAGKHCIIGSPNFTKCVCMHHPGRPQCKSLRGRESWYVAADSSILLKHGGEKKKPKKGGKKKPKYLLGSASEDETLDSSILLKHGGEKKKPKKGGKKKPKRLDGSTRTVCIPVDEILSEITGELGDGISTAYDAAEVDLNENKVADLCE